ncbi:hypothetical protein PIB30_066209 [Stylosanthes scabra]|uniref:Uncharacterized protein n=1 Tax=Stylosanthes scabra TaxID=79078 RepID=A0ABU6YMR5_9FABA|nr:hypothetical protein [Stylosanthes scabra]
MATSQMVPGLSDEGDRVAHIHPANLGCKLVVAVVRLYELPTPWISKEATSMSWFCRIERGIVSIVPLPEPMLVCSRL